MATLTTVWWSIVLSARRLSFSLQWLRLSSGLGTRSIALQFQETNEFITHQIKTHLY